MTDLRDAAKLALEALEFVLYPQKKQHEAIAALKRALAEEQRHEPVAWMTINAYGDEDDIHYENPEGKLPESWTYKPLYTCPQSTAFTPEIAAILSENQRLRAELKFNGPQQCPNCASLMEQNTELDKKLAEWVGLTDDERRELRKRNQQHDALMLAAEKLLMEKNRGV